MTRPMSSTNLNAVSTSGRGAAIRQRREHLGMTKADLAKRAGVDRGKLSRFEDGVDEPSTRWIASVERALEAFEAETGHNADDAAKAAEAGFVRIRVEGVYGSSALVLEGPPEDLPALEAAVDRLMRRLADERDGR